MSAPGMGLSSRISGEGCRWIAGITAIPALTTAAPMPQSPTQKRRLRLAPTSPTQGALCMNSNAVDGGHLTAFIERIEKLEEEKRAISDDIKDVYGEAKATGFDRPACGPAKTTEGGCRVRRRPRPSPAADRRRWRRR